MKILIVGVGNIGSRHVQSLISDSEYSLSIVDPSLDSKKNLSSIISVEDYEQINFFDNLSELRTIPDLAIISTDAKPRKNIVVDLLERGVDNFLLEKIVCQSTNDYLELLDLVNGKANVWVNFPRRYMPIYKHIKKVFLSDNEPIKMLVDAGNLGLACGAIHQIDIFQYLCDAKEFKLEKDFLKIKMIKTKRKGYNDFAGNLIINSDNSSSLTLNFTEDEFWPLLEIYRNSKRYIIVDSDNSFSKIALKSDNWKWNQTTPKASPPLVSQITKKIIDDIRLTGNCNMPTLSESFISHKLVLDLLLDFYRENIDSSKNILPIT